MHVISHLGTGGAESLVKDYSIKLNKNKFEVLIVTIGLPTNSFNEQELKENNIRIISLTDFVTFKEDDSLITKKIKKIKKIIQFRKIVKQEKPTVIHSHLNVNHYLSFTSSKYENIKMFHTLHSGVNEEIKNKKRLYYLSTNYNIKRKNMVLIALHEEMKRKANKIFNTNNSIVINNGIDIDKYSVTSKDNKRLKLELNIPDNYYIVGHVGRLVDSKNHDFIIEVFKRLNKIRPDSVLLLIGEGELKEKIKEKVQKYDLSGKVYILGNRNDIPELLSIMDVFLFPSKFEGFGNVLIEAQAAGVKCIASSSVPIATKLTNYIVYLSLNDSLDKWVEETLESFKHEKKTFGLENYEIRNTVKKLESIYNE